MTLSLVDHLHQVLAPRVRNGLADLLSIPQAKGDEVLQVLLPLIVARLVSKNDILGTDSVQQLLHANQLINIPQDAILTRDTILNARDTGLTLLPPFFRVDEDQQAAIAATVAHTGLSAQQAMDAMQILTTLCLRETAALTDSTETTEAQLGALLEAQKPLLQGRAPDWVFHAAKLSELAGKEPVIQADGTVNTAAATDAALVIPAVQDSNPQLEQAAAIRQQVEAPAQITQSDETDPQVKQVQAKRSFLSNSTLHLVFASLAAVPLLFLAYQYFNTKQEGVARNDRPANQMDSGTTGGGSVVPVTQGELPTNLPDSGLVTQSNGPGAVTAPATGGALTPAVNAPAPIDPQAIGGKSADVVDPATRSDGPENSKTSLTPSVEANATGRDTQSLDIQTRSNPSGNNQPMNAGS